MQSLEDQLLEPDTPGARLFTALKTAVTRLEGETEEKGKRDQRAW
jgi:hypothetical protein